MRARYLLGSLLVLWACSSGEGAPSAAAGGKKEVASGGGSNANGGAPSTTGGNSANGGAPSTTGGNSANGGAPSTTGGNSATGGAGNGGTSSGGASGGSGGTSGSAPCGSEGLSCEEGALCVESSIYPNNIDPNNVLPPSTSWACKTNPCGSQRVSCDCARSACPYPECSVSANKLVCIFRAVCASPDTLIATPSGDRRIADLQVGDLVYSVDNAALRPVPILRVARTPVSNHRVVEVRTGDGSSMEISPGHPTADGRLFGDLRAGDRLDGALIISSRMVDYRFAHTHDILPASDSGTYVAFGKLIGSTLK